MCILCTYNCIGFPMYMYVGSYSKDCVSIASEPQTATCDQEDDVDGGNLMGGMHYVTI